MGKVIQFPGSNVSAKSSNEVSILDSKAQETMDLSFALTSGTASPFVIAQRFKALTSLVLCGLAKAKADYLYDAILLSFTSRVKLTEDDNREIIEARFEFIDAMCVTFNDPRYEREYQRVTSILDAM